MKKAKLRNQITFLKQCRTQTHSKVNMKYINIKIIYSATYKTFLLACFVIDFRSTKILQYLSIHIERVRKDPIFRLHILSIANSQVQIFNKLSLQ